MKKPLPGMYLMSKIGKKKKMAEKGK